MNHFQSKTKRTLTTTLPKDDFEMRGKEVKFLGNYEVFMFIDGEEIRQKCECFQKVALKKHNNKFLEEIGRS